MRALIPYFSLSTAPAPPTLYTLSLHDALPISRRNSGLAPPNNSASRTATNENVTASVSPRAARVRRTSRSEEHTSELQSLRHLVCRLLLEKKKMRVTDEAW